MSKPEYVNPESHAGMWTCLCTALLEGTHIDRCVYLMMAQNNEAYYGHAAHDTVTLKLSHGA